MTAGGLAALAAFCLTSSFSAGHVVIYVSIDGRDRWSGQLAAPAPDKTDGPLRTLAAARRRARQLKRANPSLSVKVIVGPGVYHLPQSLTLTPEDSGVEWCAARPGHTFLSGGRIVQGWRKWRGQIYCTDLKPQHIPLRRYHQLFYKGRRQTLARHPNLDPSHPRTGGFLYVAERGPNPREQFVYHPGDIPTDKWTDISQAEVFCINHGGWTLTITPIISIDPKLRLITVRPARSDFRPLNRYFIQNVRDALDAPGEWFLDYKTGRLYFWPPDGAAPGDHVVLPVLDNVIELRGTIPYPPGRRNSRLPGPRGRQVKEPKGIRHRPVENIVLCGFVIQCARRDGVRLVGASRCSVVGCTVRNVGGVGINLGGVVPLYSDVGNPREEEPQGLPGGVGGAGQDLYFQYPCHNCRVAGNDVYSTGSDGIFLYGYQNVAENNHVFDVGLYDKDCAGINLWGLRCVARRNFIHHVPRNAIFLKGTDHLVEQNEIRYTMLETCDGGAIRMCQRDAALRGCIIRHNRIRDTIGYGYPSGSLQYMSPYFCWGVYLDDFTCGTRVVGNIIARTGRGGVMIHGGSDNIVEGNIVVHAAKYAIEVLPIRREEMKGNKVRQNVLLCSGDPPIAYRCLRWLPQHVVFENNLVWGQGKPVGVALGSPNRIFRDWSAWMAQGIDHGSVCADPMMANPERDDFTLRRESPAWKLGFKAIPVEQIGCYAGDDRASWPVRVPSWLKTEKPFLYRARPRPLHESFEVDLPGRRPRNGDVLDAPRARIIVSAERAFKGRHSLKFTDVPGLRFAWMPRIFYPLHFAAGRVKLSCAFWLDPDHPPRILFDPRQYSQVSGAEYYSGPAFTISQHGQLMAAGHKQLARVPLGQWFQLTLWLDLGREDIHQSPAVLTLADGTSENLSVPFVSDKFRRLDRLVICCPSDGPGIFFLDELVCQPADH